MAATGTGGKAGLGWLVLAGALAVPGFLFFNWWSHMKADRERSVATKARGRLPDGAVFQTPPADARLSNPLVSSSAPVAAAPAAPAEAPLRSAPALATPAAPPAAPIAAAAPPPPAPTVALATAPPSIVIPRDPMLSPMDIVRIREEEMSRERARMELEEANRRRQVSRRPVKYVEPPVEGRIRLQGTVAIPGGASLAIVNDTTMSLGESFAVEGYSAKVRIVKISPVGVTFEYKKRRFMMSVNQE